MPGGGLAPRHIGGYYEMVKRLDEVLRRILDAAGIPIPTTVSGRSILRVADDGGWPEDVFVQISESQVGRAVRTRRWKYAVSAPEADPVEDSRADRYQEEYLYDLASDPYELENLIREPAHRPVAERMRARLLERIRTIEGEEPEIVPANVGSAAGQRVVLAEDIEK